jgi:hypothetical protein
MDGRLQRVGASVGRGRVRCPGRHTKTNDEVGWVEAKQHGAHRKTCSGRRMHVSSRLMARHLEHGDLDSDRFGTF